jgi:hypothetical protein
MCFVDQFAEENCYCVTLIWLNRSSKLGLDSESIIGGHYFAFGCQF